MKPFIYLFIALGMLMHTSQAQQQKRFYIEPYARPFLYPLMNPTKSVGDNFNNVSYIKQITPEIGFNTGVRIWKNWSLGGGVSYMQIKHLLTWDNLYDKDIQMQGNSSGNLALNQWYWGLKMNVKYSLPKCYIELNFSANNDCPVNDRYIEWNVYYDDLKHHITPYNYRGYAQAVANYYNPFIPEVVVGYSPIKNVYLHTGLKLKFYGKETGTYVKMLDTSVITDKWVNNVTIMDKYVMLSCGLSYQFWWKFKK